MWAAYRYTGAIRPAIHRFKYNGHHALGELLGGLLCEAMATTPVEADLIVPVPLHATRLRQRGFNQSEVLARALARALDRPLATDLVRLRPTPPQVGQGSAARRANVAGAFAWHGPSLAGGRVVLLDDVCTTGATLDACAQALRLYGPAHILAVALAATDRVSLFSR